MENTREKVSERPLYFFLSAIQILSEWQGDANVTIS